MRVALVSPYPYYATGVEGTVYPPLGILYLAAAVRAQAQALLVLDCNALRLDVPATLQRLRAFAPDVVGVSVNVVTARAARELCAGARRELAGAVLVAGGPLPTACPEAWLEHAGAVVAGEGEAAFGELLRRLAGGRGLDGIPGVWTAGRPAGPAPAADPEALPLPAYDLLQPPLRQYTERARVVRPYMAPLLTSRGCPFHCTFCDKGVHGFRFRPRSPQSVLEEARWLRRELGVNQLDVLDDNFTFDAGRAAGILEGLIAEGGFAVNCHNGLRADRLSPELVALMKRAGVFKAGIGIESGSPAVLDRIKKNIDLEQVRRSIRWLRRAGITVHGFFILGLPFETAADLEATLRFARACDPHFANFTFFLPVPGTQIYRELKAAGRLLEDTAQGVSAGFFRGQPYAALEHLTAQDVDRFYSRAWRQFYLRPRKALDILATLKSWSELRWVARIGSSVVRRGLFGAGERGRRREEVGAGHGC